MGCECESVAQVKLNEASIAESLKKHILKSDILVLPPLLDLLVAFASDLPELFYNKYFYAFIADLRSLLKKKEQEILEGIFLCFISLFTVLQSYLSRDIIHLYVDNEFSSLFNNNSPWYIIDFSAQCLSYLLRKLNNQREFFIVGFHRLKKHADEIDGFGKLIFYCMRSDVNRRLHSCASSLLRLVLDIFIEEDVPIEESTSALCCALNSVANHVTTTNKKLTTCWQDTWDKDSGEIWPILLEKFDQIRTSKESDRKNNLLNSILKCILTLIKFKQGRLIVNVELTSEKLLNAVSAPEADGDLVVEIAARILISPHFEITSVHFSNVSSTIFQSNYSYAIIASFVEKVNGGEYFDDIILPLFLRHIILYLSSTSSSKNLLYIFETIGKILIPRKQIIQTGNDMNNSERFIIDLSQVEGIELEQCNKFFAFIKHLLKESVQKDDLSNLESLILVCFCIPHLAPLNVKEFAKLLKTLFKKTVKLLSKSSDPLISEDLTLFLKKKVKKGKIDVEEEPNIDFNIATTVGQEEQKLSFLLSILVEDLVLILDECSFLKCFNQSELFSLLIDGPCYRECKPLLRMLDIYLSIASRNNLLKEEHLKLIYPTLAPSLSSSDPTVRLLVSHIFSCFPIVLLPLKNETLELEERKNIFEIMFEAEMTNVTALDFRDRINTLCKLDLNNIVRHKAKSKIYDQGPILFFLGQLYINFKDIWSPVIKLLVNYALSFNDAQFWSIWFPKLKLASYFSFQELCKANNDIEEECIFKIEILNDCQKNLYSHLGMKNLKVAPDYLNYRDLLWRAMHQFPLNCERHHKEIVSLFF